MNYKDRMNAIGKASGVAAGRAGRKWGQAVPGQVYPPINGPGNPEWEKRTYPTLVGRPVDWAKAAISILSKNADPLNQETADIVNSKMNRGHFMVEGPANWRWQLDRDIERLLKGPYPPIQTLPMQPPGVPSYAEQQPPTRFLPVERPDFSQPPAGGGSTMNVQWEGPGNPSWERRMRERAMGGMR